MKKIIKYIILIIASVFSTSLYSARFFDHIKSFFITPTYEEEFTKNLFPNKQSFQNEIVFVFDPKLLAWAIYKKGVRVGTGRAIGGKDFCEDIQKPCRTVEGEYTIFRTEDKNCTSNTFPIDEGGGAPMPNCMFFYKGYAIHGSDSLPPHNASHGCIRVAKKAAEWMHTYYLKEGALVIVKPYT